MAPTIHPIPTFPHIHIALDLMSTTPPKFHWFIFIPDDPATSNVVEMLYAGTKLHAITNGLQGDDKRWSYDRVSLSLATSSAVAAAAVIGRLPTGKTVDDLDQLLQQIPMAIPPVDREREPVWTCRVWIREALRRLHENQYIVCENVDAMEEEMWGYGRKAAAMVEDDTFTIAALHFAVNSK